LPPFSAFAKEAHERAGRQLFAAGGGRGGRGARGGGSGGDGGSGGSSQRRARLCETG
jgi:hypothetical protein